MMQRIKHRRIILAAVVTALLFSGVTASAAEPGEFPVDRESDLSEGAKEPGAVGLDSLSEPSETGSGQADDAEEEADTVVSQESPSANDLPKVNEETEAVEKTEEAEETEAAEKTEEIRAGVWSDQEPFFTDDDPAEPAIRTFRMARAGEGCPTYREVYAAMTNLQDKYPEGMTWTNFEPYGSRGELGEYYRFQGGPVKGAGLGVGCAAFAFLLSDEAFGSLPSRTIDRGGFGYEDIKVGDILRVNNNSHFVIVLQVSAGGVTVAEANYNKSVHWGRTISADDIMTADFLVTRYPNGYTEDDNADDTAHEGTEGPLGWTLTNAGVLTITGTGDMPDYTPDAGPSWNAYMDDINTIIIENGVTGIGDYAFYGSRALTVYIPDGITDIGTGAFQNAKLVAATIPKTTVSVRDSAFQGCENLTSVSICEGVETIGRNAFRACTALRYLDFPASVTSVGSGAFTSCTEVVQIRFASGAGAVEIGDGAFAQCWKLGSVTLPQGLKTVSSYMFQSCTMLAEIYIPAGVSEIGEEPFTSTYIQYGGTISFGGSESTWRSIGGQFVLNAMPNANIKYNVPFDDPFASDPDDPGDFKPENPDEGGSGDKPGGSDNKPGGSDNKPGGSDNKPGGSDNKPGGSDNKPGGSDNRPGGSDNRPDGHADSGSGRERGESMSSAVRDSGTIADVEIWHPVTPDEKKRYACMGKEAVQYAQSDGDAYRIHIENAMQGPMCFQSFEAVLGDYTIGRTYHIYPLSGNAYSMDEAVQITLKIPSAIYKTDREYKMICVTKGGQPIIYSDLDSSPETITIRTNKFYAYALIYK